MISTTTAILQLNELKKDVNHMRLAAEEWDERWKTLISIIMSARTRDEVTIIVAGKLFEQYPNVESLSRATLADIQRIIKTVNFYRNKSKNILSCAKLLYEKYNGDPPSNIEELIELPGVGRKTANVFLSEMGHDEIGVDTHVSYISQRLGWTKNKDPHKIEEDLRKLFPRRYWKSINSTLVRFGKTHTNRKKKNEILDRVKRV